MTARVALRQFISHTAFYTATRLLVVRAWEDTDLLDSKVLYNGGFDQLMQALQDVSAVVEHAFSQAQRRYPDLFARDNAYTWHRPTTDAYIDAVYELANTYLGQLSSDILGAVYERELARVDRKLLGQYYTPRDVIHAMLSIVGVDPLRAQADAEGRPLRVLDVATGSGGFLVDIANRIRASVESRSTAGETLDLQRWLNASTDGLVGVEIQQFAAYLAEVNLLLQLSRLLPLSRGLRIPPLRLYCADTLTVHNPYVVQGQAVVRESSGLRALAEDDRGAGLERVRDPGTRHEWFDVSCGNPPYADQWTCGVRRRPQNGAPRPGR
ncbi:MAG TPA: N-6 DNA methylase [Candidatus Nanopelagicaceae bacterium]|nr:N-6 DNA methylase [Candidatus Nanopelagicaceae bacterium]